MKTPPLPKAELNKANLDLFPGGNRVPGSVLEAHKSTQSLDRLLSTSVTFLWSFLVIKASPKEVGEEIGVTCERVTVDILIRYQRNDTAVNYSLH